MMHTTEFTGAIESDELEVSLSNKGECNLNIKPRKRVGYFKRNNTK
ncbi:hypothetical protein [Flavicella sp.]